MSLTKVSYSMITGAFANVRDYGAVGDGTTNDAAAIQLAFDSGKSVYFPDGTYYVSNTILTLPQNAIVCGSGPDAIILGNGANPVAVLTGTSGTHKENLTLRNLTIKRTNGTYANQRQLVEITYADDCYIQNVIFDGDNATSAYPGACIGYSVTRLNVSDCQFLGGSNLNLTSVGALSTNLFSTGCIVKNCYMSPAASQGFDFYYVKDLIVDGCIAHGRSSTYGCGFIIEFQATNVTFTNCISYDNTRSGFYLEPNTAYGIASVTFNNCIAYNNGETGLYAQNSYGLVVNGGAYWGSASTFVGSNSGIALQDTAQNCVVNGAYIHSNQSAGLLIGTGNYVVVSGNMFFNNNGPAIKILNASLGLNITGNTFTSNLSIISGWVENQTGYFMDGAWASFTPTVYSNDGSTAVSISNVSAKYKRIGSVCHVEGYFEFSGSANNNVMYVVMPFVVAWTGSTTGPAAKIMRGTANGSNAGVIYIDSLYFNTSLAITGMSVSDTNVRFTAAYELS